MFEYLYAVHDSYLSIKIRNTWCIWIDYLNSVFYLIQHNYHIVYIWILTFQELHCLFSSKVGTGWNAWFQHRTDFCKERHAFSCAALLAAPSVKGLWFKMTNSISLRPTRQDALYELQIDFSTSGRSLEYRN